MFETLSGQLQAAFMACVCTLSLWKGGREERLMGIAVGLTWLASAVSQQYAEHQQPLYWTIAIDTAFLLACGLVSYTSAKNWPVVMTVVHAIGLVAHVAYIFEVAISVYTYYAVLTFSGLGVLITLLAATVLAWREQEVLAGLRSSPEVGDPRTLNSGDADLRLR